VARVERRCEWAASTPFAEDTTGSASPTGTLTKFVIEQLDTRGLRHVSILRRRLAFSHVVTASAGGGCTMTPRSHARTSRRSGTRAAKGCEARAAELDCLVALVESR